MSYPINDFRVPKLSNGVVASAGLFDGWAALDSSLESRALADWLDDCDEAREAKTKPKPPHIPSTPHARDTP